MTFGLLAFSAASAFLGATLYMLIVEQSARLALDDRAMVQEWRPSNRRGFVLLSALAVVSAALAYVTWAGRGDVRWLIGGSIVAASLPYVYFVVVPLNNSLASVSPDSAGSVSRELVRDWGLLELGLCGLGLAACACLGWALALPA